MYMYIYMYICIYIYIYIYKFIYCFCSYFYLSVCLHHVDIFGFIRYMITTNLSRNFYGWIYQTYTIHTTYTI